MGRSESISALIIGRRALLREGLAALLRGSDYKVIANVQQASELKEIHIADKNRVLAILGVDDTHSNIAEAIEAIKALRSRFSDVRIVVAAEMSGLIDIQQILTLGSDCYIVNLTSRNILLRSLDLVMYDQQMIVVSRSRLTISDDKTGTAEGVSPSIVPTAQDVQRATAFPGTTDPKFSQREQEVLRHLAVGGSNKEIARLCSITESTVKVHLKAILRKTTAQNRTQAAIWAIANGYDAPRKSSDQAVTSSHRSVAGADLPKPGSAKHGQANVRK